MKPVQSDRAKGGLSPRTRGSLPEPADPRVEVRSIPAHAGEPAPGNAAFGPRWVYPRARGGADQYDYIAFRLMGLSPRTRGSHPGRPLLHRRRRFYPRARGGAAVGLAPLRGNAVLSPRTRGSPLTRRDGQVRERSIPAHAGEPGTSCSSRRWGSVYPRARGGAESSPLVSAIHQGLSPRTREPQTRGTRRCSWWVYPRARGGSRGRVGRRRRRRGGASISAVLSASGLSPRTRGSPTRLGDQRSGRAVYPRARGGAFGRLRLPWCRSGLSPRTRGSHLVGSNFLPVIGSIPAHAGEPRQFD